MLICVAQLRKFSGHDETDVVCAVDAVVAVTDVVDADAVVVGDGGGLKLSVAMLVPICSSSQPVVV